MLTMKPLFPVRCLFAAPVTPAAEPYAPNAVLTWPDGARTRCEVLWRDGERVRVRFWQRVGGRAVVMEQFVEAGSVRAV